MSLTYLENRHNLHDSPWTAERVEQLAALWAEGLSATQIAEAIKGAKFTRMSVLGKVHRLKLPARKARQQPDQPYIRKRRGEKLFVPKLPPRPPKPPPPPPPLAPKMRQLTFAKLKPRQCRWPLGELLEPPRLFCAADTE